MVCMYSANASEMRFKKIIEHLMPEWIENGRKKNL